MHQEVGTLENHPHGHAIVEGHAKKGQVDTALLKARHDDLVDEMERRGYAHDSPLHYTDELDLGRINEQKNLLELAERCEKCRERMKQAGKLPEI